MDSNIDNKSHHLKGTHMHNGKISPLKSVTIEETPEEIYARAFPAAHRGISGCCDSALNPPNYGD